MPLVIVNRKEGDVNDAVLRDLVKVLPVVVASALDVPEEPEGRLSPSDIKVWTDSGSEFDVNTKSLEIVIWATEFPDRKADLDKRREHIVRCVKSVIPTKIHGFVWVLLQPASFGEF